MQDNGFIARWRVTGLAAIAASGACATLGACAGHGRAPAAQKAEPAPPTVNTDAAALQGSPANSLDGEPLEYRSVRADGARQIGRASYYARKFQGRRTASGERYDMHALTAAHRTLPLGSYVRVSNLSGTKSVIVRINDRGPFVKGRMIDLSFAAASELGLQQAGSAPVVIELVDQHVVRIAQAATNKPPERIMLHIAHHPRHHHRKRGHH